ncbi:MAG: ABC transporter ATP-binding protein [Methanomicrobiales archaeon]|nr:ABC transporter ATP-binding protein [Methanomicrobiales archaeon]
MIEAGDLGKRYGEKEILKEVSLSIPDGEIFGLIGPSGSGKSTLLRLLDLIEMPTEGTLSLFGEDALTADGRFRLRRRMAMLYQKPIIFNLNVYENIAIGLKFRKEREETIRRRVKEALGEIGLPEYATRSARTLSGGEAQRVALARAIVTDPEVLFLDEPTANLDPPSAEKIEEIILGLNRDAGTTIVLSTHDMLQGQHLAGRIGVMMEGRLPQTGNALEIFHRPATKKIARFVQVDNIFPGTVAEGRNGEVSVDVAGTTFCAISQLPPGKDVDILFRAEDVTIGTGGGPVSSARNIYQGRVKHLVPSGPFVRVIIDCGIDIAAIVTIRSAEDLNLGYGKEVWISVKATAIHVLPQRD